MALQRTNTVKTKYFSNNFFNLIKILKISNEVKLKKKKKKNRDMVFQIGKLLFISISWWIIIIIYNEENTKIIIVLTL